MAILSQCLQHIMLHIHQYRLCIIYKPDTDLYIANGLFWNNHIENRDHEITGMNRNVHPISTSENTPICISIKDIQVTTQ